MLIEEATNSNLTVLDLKRLGLKRHDLPQSRRACNNDAVYCILVSTPKLTVLSLCYLLKPAVIK
jgi:hypothetical protein